MDSNHLGGRLFQLGYQVRSDVDQGQEGNIYVASARGFTHIPVYDG